MNIIYEGKDITSLVDVNTADVFDRAGGIADSLEICFSDSERLWPNWSPKKNEKVEIISDGFKSGIMNIDEIVQERGFYIIRALSIPQEAKSPQTKAWENIRFLEFANEISNKYGFTLQTYGIENFLYDRVDQIDSPDFEFLSYRCRLEGYMLKITDRKVIIYNERYLEGLPVARQPFNFDDFDGKYKFRLKSTDIFSVCRLSHGSKKVEYKATNVVGPILELKIDFTSISEGERFSKNLLRYNNKMETQGSINISLDTTIAAGSNIFINGTGIAKGKFFCYEVIHRIKEKKTCVKLRKPLEGY